MAKIKFGGIQTEEARHEYDLWQPETKRMIPFGDLNEHPENYKLVGIITADKRATLKEDISKNGIREPLQVYWDSSREKLVLVSGHERVSVVRELIKEGKGKNIQFLPCIKKEFKTEEQVRFHIFQINYNRKSVRPTAEILETLFPPSEYPLLYADLRANFNYSGLGKSEKGQTFFTPEEQERARQIREQERLEQERLIARAESITGKKRNTITEARQEVAKKFKSFSLKSTVDPVKKKIALSRLKDVDRKKVSSLAMEYKKLSGEIEKMQLKILKNDSRKKEIKQAIKKYISPKYILE